MDLTDNRAKLKKRGVWPGQYFQLIFSKYYHGSYESFGNRFFGDFSDRAENLGIGLEAQVMKEDNEIL